MFNNILKNIFIDKGEFMKKCQGCGAVLQSEFPKLIGYTPKKDALVCQRCFRLKHLGTTQDEIDSWMASPTQWTRI